MLEKFLSRKRAKIVNKLIPFQHRNGRILDIGCGEYPYFLINTEFSEKYGVDRIVRNEVFDNKGKEKVFIKKSNIEKDGLRFFDDEYFDVITMLAVFEHLEPKGLPRIIKEIRRVLKLNGKLILTIPTPWGNAILQILSKLKLINSTLFKEHKAVYSVEKAASILTECGFSKEDVRFGYFELFMNVWLSAVKK